MLQRLEKSLKIAWLVWNKSRLFSHCGRALLLHAVMLERSLANMITDVFRVVWYSRKLPQQKEHLDRLLIDSLRRICIFGCSLGLFACHSSLGEPSADGAVEVARQYWAAADAEDYVTMCQLSATLSEPACAVSFGDMKKAQKKEALASAGSDNKNRSIESIFIERQVTSKNAELFQPSLGKPYQIAVSPDPAIGSATPSLAVALHLRRYAIAMRLNGNRDSMTHLAMGQVDLDTIEKMNARRDSWNVIIHDDTNATVLIWDVLSFRLSRKGKGWVVHE